jgi:hypothetical protein
MVEGGDYVESLQMQNGSLKKAKLYDNNKRSHSNTT